MLPVDYRFLEEITYTPLRKQVLQTTPVAMDIQSITFWGNEQYEVTVDTGQLTSDQLVYGMDVLIAGTTYFDGKARVIMCDYANNKFRIAKGSIGSVPNQSAVAGTATATGTAPLSAMPLDAVLLYTNNGKVYAYQYDDASAIFCIYFDNNGLDRDLLIQIVNNDSSENLTAKVEFSLDGVYTNRDDFPTAISLTVNAGTNQIAVIAHRHAGVWVYVTVTNTNQATFFVNAK